MARKMVKKKGKDKKVFKMTANMTNLRNMKVLKRGGIRL